MDRSAQRRTTLFLLGIVFASVLAAPGLAPALGVGEKAPDFTLPSTRDQDIRLSDFQGKKLVLLEFFVADFAAT